MLIKLDAGVSADLDDVKQDLKVGSTVLRYVYTEAYDKGEVTEIDGDQVTVDFADTVRAFEKAKIALVYGNGHDEHWAVFEEGKMLKDFRGNRGKTTDMPQINTLEDLLDFDKWMV